MKSLLLYVLTLTTMLQSCAQSPKDLSQVSFTENTGDFLKTVSAGPGGQMYGLSDMLSYGIDNNGILVYDHYLPSHVELLSLGGKVAGFAFKIGDFKSQQKLISGLKARYPKLALADSSRWGKIYRYTDKQITMEVQAIDNADFKAPRTGYFSIKTIALAKAIDEQEKKYQRKPE